LTADIDSSYMVLITLQSDITNFENRFLLTNSLCLT